MELDYTEIHHSRKILGTDKGESMEEGRIREILTTGLHKNAERNWEAPLPFKTDTIILPDNKGHCLRHLFLKRRLLNDKLQDDYLPSWKKTLDNRHASRVPLDQLTTAKGKAWYIPYFHLFHPRKPDQIRVVFDCSAVYENESLNKHLVQGPDQLNPLIGVLTRFRKEAVALTCEIEQMFHSFYVNLSDIDYLRFLWLANNDFTGPIVECRLNVHLITRSNKILLTSDSRR